jgi:hypothetical protein
MPHVPEALLRNAGTLRHANVMAPDQQHTKPQQRLYSRPSAVFIVIFLFFMLMPAVSLT